MVICDGYLSCFGAYCVSLHIFESKKFNIQYTVFGDQILLFPGSLYMEYGSSMGPISGEPMDVHGGCWASQSLPRALASQKNSF